MKRITTLLSFFILLLSYFNTTYAQEIDLSSTKMEIEQAAFMEQTAFETGGLRYFDFYF